VDEDPGPPPRAGTADATSGDAAAEIGTTVARQDGRVDRDAASIRLALAFATFRAKLLRRL
jgi:hypothetical protein